VGRIKKIARLKQRLLDPKDLGPRRVVDIHWGNAAEEVYALFKAG
jgi:hypothetical protein